MKNVRLMFIPFLILGMFMMSCKNDDDSTNNVDRIVGSWEITDVKANGMSVYDILIATPEGCFLNTKIHFYNDYTFIANPYEINEMDECVQTADRSGTWSKNGDVYTYTFSGETSSSETVNFINDNQFSYTVDAENISYELILSRM